MSPRITCSSTSPAMADYGKLSRSLARRDDRRRARRCRALQARSDGLRAVEAVEAGRAGVAVARAGIGGRPGWHIECSAMAGDASRRDRSTSTAAASTSSSRITRTSSPSRAPRTARQLMAKIWMHNGFLQVEGKKMAKSEGQLRHHPRAPAGLAGRGAAPQHAAHALPPADRLDAERAGGEPQGARPLAPRGRRCASRRREPIRFSTRCWSRSPSGAARRCSLK